MAHGVAVGTRGYEQWGVHDAGFPEGGTSLHLAAYHPDPNTIRTLVDGGAPLEEQDDYGFTALDRVVWCCQPGNLLTATGEERKEARSLLRMVEKGSWLGSEKVRLMLTDFERKWVDDGLPSGLMVSTSREPTPCGWWVCVAATSHLHSNTSSNSVSPSHPLL